MDVRKAIWHGIDPYEGFRDWADKEVPLSGWDIRSQVIKTEIDNIKPKQILEIGAHQGASACWMAMCAPEAHILTVDPWVFYGKYKYESRLHRFAFAQDYFRRCVVSQGLTDQITYLPMTSDKAFHMFGVDFPDWEWDLAYIDGGHSYEQCLQDIKNAHLVVRGPIIVDDYNEKDFPGVCKAVQDFCKRADEKFIVKGRKAVIAPS